MSTVETAITVSWTVNEVLHRFPGSALVLNNLGVDTCCGAMNTLDVAAQNAGMLPGHLLAALLPCSSDVDAELQTDVPVAAHPCACFSHTQT